MGINVFIQGYRERGDLSYMACRAQMGMFYKIYKRIIGKVKKNKTLLYVFDNTVLKDYLD